MRKFLCSAALLVVCVLLAKTGEAYYVTFETLPDTIRTNIPLYPVSTYFSKMATNLALEFYLNDREIFPYSSPNSDNPIFELVELDEGDNPINLRVIYEDGQETVTTKHIIYDPLYATNDLDLLYFNQDLDYVEDGVATRLPSSVVIDINNHAILGVIKGFCIYGVSRDGSRIFTHDGHVISTTDHRLTGQMLPGYQGGRMVFSHDDRYVYYATSKVDLDTFDLVDTIPDVSSMPSVSPDDRRIYLSNGYVELDTNTFQGVPYSHVANYADARIEPAGRFVMTASYASEYTYIRCSDPETGQLIYSDRWHKDYTRNIDFSPDGKFAYIAASQNPVLTGLAGIIIIDLDSVMAHAQTGIPVRYGSTNVVGTEAIFASRDSRVWGDYYSGLVEYAPIKDPLNLLAERQYYLRCWRNRSKYQSMTIKVPYDDPDVFIRGDANRDKKVDISDAIKILRHLFVAPGLPEWAVDGADANDDGKIDISDAVRILAYLFAKGDALPAPFPDPGFDPTPEGL